MRQFDRPPAPKRIPLASWQPVRRRVGQSLVTVNPNVNVAAPINIELGNLPLSLGLFAGSAVAFVGSGHIPKGAWRTAAIVGGVGLAGYGVYNLFAKKAPAGAPAGVIPKGPPAPVVTTDARGNQVTSEVVNVPTQSAFDSISGKILNPKDFDTVNLWSWQGSYPVKVQFHNNSSDLVDFTLEMTGEETPAPFGEEAVASYTQQVALGPGETKNVDIAMPTVTWGFSKSSVDIVLTLRKRRTAGDRPVSLDWKDFVIN